DPNTSGAGSSAADLNVIPAAIIKRAEILTGGASSVYGADAVAGVVNFIMDTHFEGIRFDGNYSVWQHNQDNPFVADCPALSAFVMQNTGTGIPRCGGSATANPGTAVLFPGGGGSSLYALGPATIAPGQNLFNFAPLNYYQRPDERYIAGAFADYEISSALKP